VKTAGKCSAWNTDRLDEHCTLLLINLVGGLLQKIVAKKRNLVISLPEIL